jgi:hypothetical protein
MVSPLNASLLAVPFSKPASQLTDHIEAQSEDYYVFGISVGREGRGRSAWTEPLG